MSTGMVSLGIATAYERHYGVLKRLGGTPLGRPRLIGAKILAVLVVEAVQVALIALVAGLAFDWRPAGGLAPAFGVAMLGTVAFAGLGLAMAGSLRAEAVLALANGLYLLFLLIRRLLPAGRPTPARRRRPRPLAAGRRARRPSPRRARRRRVAGGQPARADGLGRRRGRRDGAHVQVGVGVIGARG